MNHVFYFSGTGNCQKVAADVALALGDCSLTKITRTIFKSEIAVTADTCVIVYPSYAFGAPSMVLKFFKTAKINAGYLALVTTYGSNYGGTLAAGKAALKNGAKKPDFYFGIKTVENYIPIFGAQREDNIQSKLLNQELKTAELIDALKEKRKKDIRAFRPFSAFVSIVFRIAKRFLCKFFVVTKACTGCGACKAACPADAITMRPNSQKPRFSGKYCEHCQACLNVCPHNAILFARMTKKTKRYINPHARSQIK